MKTTIAPGALDEIAHLIGATSDHDLATFIGVTEDELEGIRYGRALTPQSLARLAGITEARRKTEQLIATLTA